MAFETVFDRFPDLGLLLAVDGSAFEALMGPEWARKNPKVPVFQSRGQVGRLLDENQLQMRDIRAGMERFLADERVFDDRSEEVEAIRAVYRDLFLRLAPGFWDGLQGRLTSTVNEPEAHAHAALLALSLWPEDPRKDPASWKLWFSAGFAFVHRGDAERAGRFLECAIGLEPGATPAINELAALRLQQERSEEGEILLKRLLELDPDNFLALCNYAGLRIRTGRLDEARRFLERAKAIDPDDPFLKRLIAAAGATP